MDNNANSINNTPTATPAPQPVMQYYQPAPPKEYKAFEKKDFVFLALYVVASFLMVSLGVFGGFHLGFVLAYFVLFVITTIYLVQKGKRADAFSVICGVLSIVGASTLALYSDMFINVIMLILVAGLFAVYTLGLTGSFANKKGSFRMLFDLFLNTFWRPFNAISDVVGGIKTSAKGNKKSLSGIIGFAIAIPFVLIIGALLVSSDAAFEGLVSKVFTNIGIYLLQLTLAILVVPYMFSKAYANRNKLYVNSVSGMKSKKGVPVSAPVAFLGAISVLYIVYLFSQLAYFFSAFKGILPDGYEYTASEFARRGFFEMFAICVINILLIAVATAIAKKKSIMLKLLSCFISLFSLLLIVTALQKMRLNVSIYGLSKNRIMVTVFMLMMVVVIAFFILHIFAPKISYMQPIILICSAMFIALSFADIDTQIAKYNINAYETGAIESLDVDTIGDLSDSAVPYLVELTENEDEEIAKKALRICGELYATNYADYFNGESNSVDSFKKYSMANSKAVLALDDAKRSEDIAKTSMFYTGDGYDSDYYYNEDEDFFEHYDDYNIGTEYHYNKKTGLYDIKKKVNYDVME